MSESSERFWTFVAVLVFICILLFATSKESYSQGPACDPMEKITTGLNQMHGETPRAFAKLDEGGSPIIIFVNPTSGTWTIIMLMSDDIGCIVTSGTNWKESLQSKGKAL